MSKAKRKKNASTNPSPTQDDVPVVIEARRMDDPEGLIVLPAGVTIKAAEPETPEPETPKAPIDAPESTEPARVDQWQCPSCFKFGAPCTGGTKRRPAGVTRYRKCSHCRWVFSTFQPHGGEERLYLQPPGREMVK